MRLSAGVSPQMGGDGKMTAIDALGTIHVTEATQPAKPGRRERNKQEKLDRITTAPRELFAQRGVDEVTTQEIADKAGIGAGTLFLYARSKSELLLLVQNSTYAEALEQGQAAAAGLRDRLEAVMAVVRPVVECNRKQVDTGRTYLRDRVR